MWRICPGLWVVFSVLAVGCYPDEDGDGYAADKDCADHDVAIHPEQDELCDGVDQDCDSVDDCLVRDGDGWVIRGPAGSGLGSSLSYAVVGGKAQLFVSAAGVEGGKGEAALGRVYRFELSPEAGGKTLAPSGVITAMPGERAAPRILVPEELDPKDPTVYLEVSDTAGAQSLAYQLPARFTALTTSGLEPLLARKLEGGEAGALAAAFKVGCGGLMSEPSANMEPAGGRCAVFAEGAKSCNFCWQDDPTNPRIDVTMGQLLSDASLTVALGQTDYTPATEEGGKLARGRVLLLTLDWGAPLCRGTVYDPSSSNVPRRTLVGEASSVFGSDVQTWCSSKGALLAVGSERAYDHRGGVYVYGRSTLNGLGVNSETAVTLAGSGTVTGASVKGGEPAGASSNLWSPTLIGGQLGLRANRLSDAGVNVTYSRHVVSGLATSPDAIVCAQAPSGSSSLCSVGGLQVSFQSQDLTDADWDHYSEVHSSWDDGPGPCPSCGPPPEKWSELGLKTQDLFVSEGERWTILTDLDSIHIFPAAAEPQALPAIPGG